MPAAAAPTTPAILILTGAGISRESGLDTFRCAGGLWSQVRLEDVATPDAYARDPARVHAFYNARRRQLADPAIQPNAAHLALARLERHYPGPVLLVTQNIDDLHQRAGSRQIIAMHGELKKLRCTACAMVIGWDGDADGSSLCPHCASPGTSPGTSLGTLRPHVVWFGEQPLAMEEIHQALETCGLFLSIGTSGTVYPAAGFVAHLAEGGLAHTVELNLAPSDGASLFDEAHYGPATVVVPAMVERILGGDIPGWI